MNDEIREILDYFRKYATIRENTMISEIEDYITNLQKEIRVNNDLIPHFKNRVKELKKEITNLQKENERLKENLQQEKKDFKEANDYCFELKDYKSRCENAYEELTYMSSSDYVEDYDIKQNCWIKLSNILQNGSENND